MEVERGSSARWVFLLFPYHSVMVSNDHTGNAVVVVWTEQEAGSDDFDSSFQV